MNRIIKAVSFGVVSFVCVTGYFGISRSLPAFAGTPPRTPERLAQVIHSLNDLPRNWQGLSGDAISLDLGALLIDHSQETARKELSNGFNATYDVRGTLQIARGRILKLKSIMLWVNYENPSVIELSISMDDPLVIGFSAGVRYNKDLNRYELADFPQNGARNFVFSAPANF